MLNLLSLLGIAANFGVLPMCWNDLPERVPIHFGVTGVADGWGPKQHMLLLPLMALAIYIIVTIAVHFGAAGNSLITITPENAERQKEVTLMLTSWIKGEILWLFVFIQWQSIQVAMGRADGLGGQFLLATLLVILGNVGYYVWRSYQLR